MSDWKIMLAEAKALFDDRLIDQQEYNRLKAEALSQRQIQSTSRPAPVNPMGEMGTMVGTSAMLDQLSDALGRSLEGTLIGSHQVIALLGEGGMGSVYRGRHTMEAFAKAEGDVAIKVIQPRLAQDPQFRNRFVREASLGKRISHPNIAKVVSINSDNNQLSLVMEYIEGKELKDLIPEGGMSIDEVVRLLKPIASALDYLHEQGIVHRDMKPANVRVKPDGTPVILDFGIAKDTNEVDSGMTQTGTAMGTQSYMAPEQMDARSVTGAADQYALAMMVYQMLSGKFPWEEGLSSVRITVAKMSNQLVSLKDVNANLMNCSPTVMRGLSLNPSERFPSCTQFIQALSQRNPTSSESGSQSPLVPTHESFGPTSSTTVTQAEDEASELALSDDPVQRFLSPFVQLSNVSKLAWVALIFFTWPLAGGAFWALLLWLVVRFFKQNRDGMF